MSLRVAPVVSLIRLLAVVVMAVGLMALVAGSAFAATAFTSTVSFSGQGSDPGLLDDAQRSAIRTSTGELFVADRDNDRVQVFDTATNAVVGQFGDSSVTDGPVGVAVDQTTGDVYVSSSASNTITKWSDSGLGYVQDLLFVSPGLVGDPVVDGQLGSFAAPLAVAPGSGDLLVGDPGRQLVQRFDSSGVFQSSFDGGSSGQVFGALKDIAGDSTGDVFVVDGGRVVRFDAGGVFEATLDAVPGPGLVAVDPVSGNPVVAFNVDDGCAVDRIASYVGTALESTSVVPPSPQGDCAFPSGLAFTGSGSLYASTKDVCDDSNCGGVAAIHVLDRTPTLPYTAATAPATNVTETTARLRGSLDPAGADVTYAFEYTADGVNWASTGDQGPFDDASSIPVQANVAGLTDGTTHSYRIAVRATATPGIIAYSNTETFTTIDGDPPTATIGTPTDLTAWGATLNGTVNPNGLATTARFEISGDGGNSWTTFGDTDPGAGTADVAVSAATPALEPNREYLTRLTATNIVGSASSDGTVTTLGEQATVDNPSAGQVTSTSARLSGSVDPRNSDTTWRFEYGPTDSYGSSTPDDVAASTLVIGGPDDPFDPSTPARSVGKTLNGLQPATTYHYRLVADNGNGPAVQTTDQTFTTAPPVPVAVTGAVTDVTASTATVSGAVDTHGLSGTARFSVVQTDGGYGVLTAPVALDSADGPQQLSAAVAGLPAGASYAVRMVATTGGGTRSGDAVAFSTNPTAGYQPPAAPPASGGDWASTLSPAPSAMPVSNSFTARAKKVAGTVATLTVTAHGAGTLKATGNRIKTTTKRLAAKGKATLRIKLTKTGRAALRKAETGRLPVRVRLVFTPTDGTSRTVTKTITFKRKASR